jgi:hypothetical protein
MVVIWEDMLTLFGLRFHFCHGLSKLTATIFIINRMMANHSCPKASGTDRYRGRSHAHFFTDAERPQL